MPPHIAVWETSLNPGVLRQMTKPNRSYGRGGGEYNTGQASAFPEISRGLALSGFLANAPDHQIVCQVVVFCIERERLIEFRVETFWKVFNLSRMCRADTLKNGSGASNPVLLVVEARH